MTARKVRENRRIDDKDWRKVAAFAVAVGVILALWWTTTL